MIAPMPMQVRSNAPSARFICRSGAAASAIRWSGLFVLEKLRSATSRNRVIMPWLVNLKIRLYGSNCCQCNAKLWRRSSRSFGAFGERIPGIRPWTPRKDFCNLALVWPMNWRKFVLGDAAISAVEQAAPRQRRFFGRRKIQSAAPDAL